MDKKAGIVFRGFLELNSEEQSDVVFAINEYDKKGTYEKQEIRKSYEKDRVVLGPLGSVCPCCGR